MTTFSRTDDTRRTGTNPLPSDAYVAHEGSYYQTKHVVTGRTQIERQLVRVDPFPKSKCPTTQS